MKSKQTVSAEKFSIKPIFGLLAVLGFGYCTESFADNKDLETYKNILEEQFNAFGRICLDKNRAMLPDPKEADRQGELFSCSEEARTLRKRYGSLLNSLGCKNEKASADQPCPVTGKPIDVQALDSSLGAVTGKLKEDDESEIDDSKPSLSKEYSAPCFPGVEQEAKCRLAADISLQRRNLPLEQSEKKKTSIKKVALKRRTNEAKAHLLDNYRSTSQLATEFLLRTCPAPLQSSVMKALCKSGNAEGQGLVGKSLKKGDTIYPDLKVLENRKGMILVEAKNGDICLAPQQRFQLENVLLELNQTEQTYQSNMGLLTKGGLPREFTVYKEVEGWVKGDANENKVLKPCIGKPLMECLFIHGKVSRKDFDLFNRIYGDASRDASDVFEKMSNSSRTLRDPLKLVSIVSEHLAKSDVTLNFAAAAEGGSEFRKLFEKLKNNKNTKEIIQAYEYNVLNRSNPNLNLKEPAQSLIGDILIQPVQRATKYTILVKEIIKKVSTQQEKPDQTIQELGELKSGLDDRVLFIDERKEQAFSARKKVSDASSDLSTRLASIEADLKKLNERPNKALFKKLAAKQGTIRADLLNLKKSGQATDDAEIAYAKAIQEKDAKAAALNMAELKADDFSKRQLEGVKFPRSESMEDELRMQFKADEVKAEKAALEAKVKAAQEALKKATQVEEEKKAELERTSAALSRETDKIIRQSKK